MVATENSLRKWITFLAVEVILVASGCAPSGPRALLIGDALLREGQPAQAIEKLTQATRLMPDEPRAWNLLGLAYHRAGQPQLALQAYRQALAKDRSNRVAVAHFNLGCLLLEQSNPAAAADELRSFTLMTNSAVGFVKLATAQMRLRQFENAERNLNAALRLDLKNFEALNGLGVIHAHRNQRDAGQYFSSALQWNPKYAPALLNSALLAQQNPAARTLALQRFRDYLAAAPRSPHAESVKWLVQQLETELAPRAPVASSTVISAVLKTNALLAALQASNHVPATSPPPRMSVAVTNEKAHAAIATTNKPMVSAVPVSSSPVATAKPPPVVTNAPPPAPTIPMTVVTVSNEPPPLPAKAIEASSVPRSATPPQSAAISPEPVEPRQDLGVEEAKKPGFFARLNPFRGKKTPETNDVPRAVVLNPSPSSEAGAIAKAEFLRYTYLSPAPPRSGNRADAERAMAQAVKAQRAGNMNEARLDYQLATSADPGFFDAQYNAALFALNAGDLKRALAGSELALAIQPDSINARYNFALALKQADYPIDAVVELQRILEAKPKEVRAHLTLGNLYAQQLNEPRKARAHYLKVLELDPRNSQAAAIRFWLAANP